MPPVVAHTTAHCSALLGTGDKCWGMGKLASALRQFLVSKYFRVAVQLGAGDGRHLPPSIGSLHSIVICVPANTAL